MSKKIYNESNDLFQTILAHPEGLSVDEIQQLQGNASPKRTVQYRLSNLVKLGILKIVGGGRNSKYIAVEKNSALPFQQTGSIIPLTVQSQELKKMVSKPIQLRRHVSYNREFLDSYQPNQTFYLTPQILEKLKILGNSGGSKDRPAGTYARKIYQRLLIDLSWNSSRLEGNTYSLLETEKLLSSGEEAIGKDHIEALMILNHKDAIEFIVDLIEEVNVDRRTILNIHALLSNNLLLDPRACGRLRQNPVRIGQSVYHPVEVPQLIEEYFTLIIEKAGLIKNPFEQSFFLMVHLPYLQPFLDVNKRVSRLAGNIPLIRENLSPLSFVDVPEDDYIQGLLAIYELNRIDLFRDIFVWAYERSSSLYTATLEAIGQPDPFRVRYRESIRRIVSEIVNRELSRFQAAEYITKFVDSEVAPEDRIRFVEVIEVELSSLHEGNFARFKIRPSIFLKWQKQWNSGDSR